MNRLLVAATLLALMSAAHGNPAQQIMLNLDDAKRNIALARMLNSSGERCGSVSRNFHQGNDKHGNAYWNAQCSSGIAYVVRINNDSQGSTRLLDCRTLAATGGVKCFTKF